jgi:threonine aldolase
MRAAMAEAIVGDEQREEDPTVVALNERVANLLGKDEAIFLPSGTMANLVSILVHCRRGDEIFADASNHLFHFEAGGPAGIAGAMVTPIQGRDGIFTPEMLERSLRVSQHHTPRPRLVWIEQTTNLGGGRVWPLTTLQAIRSFANNRGFAVHIDGARLLNAAVAHGVSPEAFGLVADSLWIDFTKGLGAPFGAVLCGSHKFIADAKRFKHMLGGGMRQAGHMAAACLYALDCNVTRLATDHAHARLLAQGLSSIAGVEMPSEVETNIVIIDIAGTGISAAEAAERFATEGVRVGVFGPTVLRLVTHLDVSGEQIEAALNVARRALGRKS